MNATACLLYTSEQEGVPVQDAVVTVDNRTTRTDVRGIFKIVFPLREQTLSKSVRIEKEGYLPRLRVDECPDAKNLTPYPLSLIHILPGRFFGEF